MVTKILYALGMCITYLKTNVIDTFDQADVGIYTFSHIFYFITLSGELLIHIAHAIVMIRHISAQNQHIFTMFITTMDQITICGYEHRMILIVHKCLQG